MVLCPVSEASILRVRVSNFLQLKAGCFRMSWLIYLQLFPWTARGDTSCKYYTKYPTLQDGTRAASVPTEMCLNCGNAGEEGRGGQDYVAGAESVLLLRADAFGQ